MAKRDKNDIAKPALKNLAKALVAMGGGTTAVAVNPLLGLLTKVFGDSIIDVVESRLAGNDDVQRRFESIRNENAARDIDSLKSLMLEVAGVAQEERPLIEECTAPLADPDRIGEHERLRAAMPRRFGPGKMSTDAMG